MESKTKWTFLILIFVVLFVVFKIFYKDMPGIIKIISFVILFLIFLAFNLSMKKEQNSKNLKVNGKYTTQGGFKALEQSGFTDGMINAGYILGVGALGIGVWAFTRSENEAGWGMMILGGGVMIMIFLLNKYGRKKRKK